uniref:Uncharacterized protein n=1 Tax=Rhizochromulina marina TaxID=1034831 RepID=A0A7S2S9J9_9STRA|mmetsp:Transcript_26331/g.76774  ORF Transcript_26331/g.76774 Transcript_26331/m.76774 type:complete len:129 (+) Transcript_26331:113-499(+)
MVAGKRFFTSGVLWVGLLGLFGTVLGSTTVRVVNQHSKAITVSLKGEGVGGCDGAEQPIAPNGTDASDCWCLWGTLNYHFYAFDDLHPSMDYPLCKSTSIGNCYASGYTCTITDGESARTGLCSCVEN